MTELHDHPDLVAVGFERTYAAGQSVFEVGDPLDAVHVVIDGVVLVRSVSIDGDSAVVDVRGRGDLLDDTAVLEDRPALHYEAARTVTVVRLLRIPRRSFDDARDRSPDLGAVLVRQLSDQVRRLSAALVDLLGRPGRARAARRLLALSEALARSDLAGSALVLTQQDVADFAGTTRSTLNAYLQEFEETGALTRSRGRITITDPRALEAFA
jgi:CRP-like cAMP-binding protein